MNTEEKQVVVDTRKDIPLPLFFISAFVVITCSYGLIMGARELGLIGVSLYIYYGLLVGFMVVAVGLFRLKNWALVAAIFLSFLSGVDGLVQGNFVTFAVYLSIFLYLILSKKVKLAFAKEKKQ